MPNEVTINGLETKTLTEVTDDLVAALQAIYGDDINVSQNSPDGQLINIFAQAVIDNLELLIDVYNGFSVEAAYGVILDQRVALNGLSRIPGTYTITPVSITVDRALTLTGLDALDSDPNASVFTVADDAGNQFYLEETQAIAVAGTASYDFRAVEIGQVETSPNTITNQITTVLGVTAVNNPAVASTTGINEETDAQLKIRHAAMFKLASTGPADAVRAAILEVENVVDAFVVENETGATIADGPENIPAHTIWAIANGGTDADVAEAIYNKKAPGCGMYGATTVVVTRPQGNSVSVKFSRAASQNLWIQFSIVARYAGASWDESDVQDQLAAALSYRLGQAATIGDVVSAMLTIVPQGYLVSMGVSKDGVTYQDNVNPTSSKYYFVTAAARINIV